ncbi:MAG: bifunctional pyr operon transcriptional regulator/uracil phosphoribosyltransferase PyrR [Candidatus Marinimicrobia bacterium]|mgnify:FL=1|jgi:pyrimidine operon attenuation protein/uracil phosphoribosyltransferase|nr:bifunctional pyr operon transcriptional regulator/uracil phosphoribosyltransferase PyrR [Candidatus Neomarinimicrobiota bacterium]NLA22022.1 bifunctional pyr operon transcriptional regulator/uracil phosphoribosyltransferase PyrR [Candidatus Neomarinimicrobiota bacterium]HNZ36560.1 bifunctional pyr operon transcriptional regulator/uracil phosphoribosyltransferase PyrR [Candidatus Neomarinimicrobiota bacterium]HOD38364.1 bifunctional pyr operon transcriptional regulator/uracil phosphoribosyltra
MEFRVKARLADEQGVNRTITRLAHEIIENCKGTENVGIIGIRTRGDYLAKRLAHKIEEIENVKLPVGVLDVVMYRDDFRMKTKLPRVEVTDIPFDVDGKILILVDDVIYTGRTIRAALDALMDFGRPAAIQLAVLVDRGHRELPIKPDYVGKNVPTSIGEEVRVMIKEIDGRDEILLVEEQK